ncbi:MAG TPA: hypothetical protein VIU12_18930 [Chryseolinea sp.]
MNRFPRCNTILIASDLPSRNPKNDSCKNFSRRRYTAGPRDTPVMDNRFACTRMKFMFTPVVEKRHPKPVFLQCYFSSLKFSGEMNLLSSPTLKQAGH